MPNLLEHIAAPTDLIVHATLVICSGSKAEEIDFRFFFFFTYLIWVLGGFGFCLVCVCERVFGWLPLGNFLEINTSFGRGELNGKE